MSRVEDSIYRGQVFFIKLLNLYHMIDYRAKPCVGCLVAVERLSSNELWIERFHGQRYIGVVRALKPYKWASGRKAILAIAPFC
jgi:hypothetical protein